MGPTPRKGYREGKFDEGLNEGPLTDLQTQWIQDVGSQPLPRCAEQKFLDGAFSSLLGVTFQEASLTGLVTVPFCGRQWRLEIAVSFRLI
jgi:hypothetical protein